MIQIDLNANVRDKFGKGASRTLRRAGRTPAVFYGPKTEPVALDLESRGFYKSLIDLQRRNAVINLTISDKAGKTETHRAMIKELQTDPILNSLVHADFVQVAIDAPMALRVPINYVGKAKGADLGGDVNFGLHDVLLKGLILDLPDFIEVDISGLNIGDSISCRDLPVAAGLTLLEDADHVCVSVDASARAAAATEAA